ncbi:putative Zinc import ATP-binding protein ZnuC [uncultured spirochete]|uniref:Putative Zinc import ATP-binding protein ZnuC n=1 Tax=uncultured spirochete TaxID=156406 RepID=A0A3P3XQ23_9SPIR|nr:putative Zinc import ATP-binding protein ZnuC [uncultured spirochete]
MSAGAADKAPCDGQSILSAKMLSIGYRRAQPVVRDICVDFPAALRKAWTGEKGQRDNVFGFVGPNGAGKTTLLKTCLGLLSPLGGELRLLGVDTRKACFAETRKKLAYIPQNRPEGSSGQLRISVREAVSFGRLGKCGLTGRFNRADREAVEAAILYCGLETLADKAVQDLSGGQFQRVAIARAMAAEPALYLFDEPGSYLDEEGQAAMQNLIRSLAESGIPLIIVSHDRALIALCDTVLLFEKGTARLLDAGAFLSKMAERDI